MTETGKNETIVPTGLLGRGKLMSSCLPNCTNDSTLGVCAEGSSVHYGYDTHGYDADFTEACCCTGTAP